MSLATTAARRVANARVAGSSSRASLPIARAATASSPRASFSGVAASRVAGVAALRSGVAAPDARVAAERPSRATGARRFGAAPAPASAAPSPPAGHEPIIRFVGDDGEEYFGTFTDALQTRARVAAPDAEGAMRLTREERRVELLLPPVDPPAVWCVGLNYACHAAEVGMAPPRYPILFSKAVTALTAHGQPIVLPSVAAGECDYEAELGVVIGRDGRDIAEADAMAHVLGYTVVNDVTARRWQGKKGGGQWLRGKSFDSFCPVGPALVPAAAVPDPHALRIRTSLNGELVQDGTTASMLTRIPALIAFISQGTTLRAGTLIATGTPAGVGYVKSRFLKRGDVVTISIDSVGVLTNHVAEEDADGTVHLS